MRDLLTESMVVSQRDFQEHKAEFEAYKAEKMRLWLIIGAAFAVALIVMGFVIYRILLKNKQLEFETKLHSLRSDIETMESDYRSMQTKVETMHSKVESLESEKNALAEDSEKQREEIRNNKTEILKLFGQNWSELNVLSKILVSDDGGEIPANVLHHNLKGELESIKNSVRFKDIEESVNSHFNGVISKIRQEFPTQSKEDIRILSLSLAGFSARSISLLTGLKTKTVYQKRNRLVSKIEQSDFEEKQLILAILTRPKQK